MLTESEIIAIAASKAIRILANPPCPGKAEQSLMTRRKKGTASPSHPEKAQAAALNGVNKELTASIIIT